MSDIVQPVGANDLEFCFATTRVLVTQAAESGRSANAASLKVQLMREVPGFDERAFGFAKFIDFLRAAEKAGHLTVSLDDKGHPRISPIGTAPVRSLPGVPTASRMRRDVWTAFVTWEQPTVRYWDQKTRRAILVPVDEDGQPLWVSQPDRFVEIEPVSMEQQIDLMRSFAEAIPDASQRAKVSAALSEDAPPGAFRTALTAERLGGSWATFLQRHVSDAASRWARQTRVPPHLLFEPSRTRSASPRVSTTGDDRAVLPGFSSPKATGADLDALTPLGQLRSRMHAVIDAMSLAELAALQVPAAYLIER